MFDNYIRTFEIVRKELLFLVFPTLLLALTLYLCKSVTLPQYLEIKNKKEMQNSLKSTVKQKDSLLNKISMLLENPPPFEIQPQRETISKNSAMALLFAKAKEASIVINRSTPGTTDKKFTISLDFRCSFSEILTYLSLLNEEKNLLSVDAISLNRDRSSLRCSMRVKFFNCGDGHE